MEPIFHNTVKPGYSAPGYNGNFEIVDKFKGFEKAPLFILSLYIVEFGYSGQICPLGRVPLYRGLTV